MTRPDAQSVIRAAIIDTIEHLGSGTSFVELERGIETAGIDPSGDLGISPGKLWDRNIVIWVGVSHDMAEAFAALHDAGLIQFRPTQAITYWVDGKVPNLPLAKQLRRYKTPRWLPATIGPGPQWANRNGVAK